MSINTDMTVRVAAITQVAEKVKRFRLERVDGAAMPIFSGGSHVVVAMRDGEILRRNTYSLMSSPRDTSAYELSILRVENSRGGSAFLHEKLKVGDTLVISQPLNLFPFRCARPQAPVHGGRHRHHPLHGHDGPDDPRGPLLRVALCGAQPEATGPIGRNCRSATAPTG